MKRRAALLAVLLAACPSRDVPIKQSSGAPRITSINPSSTDVGGSAFTLFVHGRGFVNGSGIVWNGAVRPTTFLSGVDLTAKIAAADLATGGIVAVTVFTAPPGGGASNAFNFTIKNPAPVLSAISPSAGTAGTAVKLTVTGQHFVKSSVVQWNSAARVTQFGSETQLTADLAATDVVAGSQRVTVMTPTPGGGTSGPLTLSVVNPAPVLTALTPNSATAGEGSVTVMLSGAGFVNASVVQWNGAPRPAAFIDPTQLSLTIPPSDLATPDTASITVFNATPGGGTSEPRTLTISVGIPVITSLDPPSGSSGSALSLTVHGTKFISGATVEWNGAEKGTVFQSNTRLVTSIFSGDTESAGVMQVTVKNPGTASSNSLPFSIYNPAPAPSGLSPSSATTGSDDVELNVFGESFVRTSTIEWNGAALQTAFVSNSQIAALIPAADLTATGTFTVTVINPPPGGGGSVGFPFTINNPVPSITTLSKQSATVGEPAFDLVINGTNFVKNSIVNLGSISLLPTVYGTTQMAVHVPASVLASAATLTVKVTNPSPGGGDSNGSPFTVNNPQPSITNVSPSSATAGAPDFMVTIAGSNFLTGATVALDDGNGVQTHPATNVVSDSNLTFLFPGSATASTQSSTQLTVTNPSPSAGGASVAFTLVPLPTLSGFEPLRVTVGATAFALTVNGANFLQQTVLHWAGAPRTTTFVSGVRLTIPVTAQDVAIAGAFDLTAQNSAPSGTSAPRSFVVNNPATGLSAGTQQGCALSASGGVKCWGSNATGALGDNTQTKRTVPVDVMGLTAGVSALTTGSPYRMHNCAALAAGGVRCWGNNASGQLGDNSTVDRLSPIAVAGLTAEVRGLSAGFTHTCAVTATGSIQCWGTNESGQLGSNDTVDHLTPIAVVGLTSGVVAVAAGSHFTCALTAAGGVKCWGDNNNGALGSNGSARKTPGDVSGLTSGVVSLAGGDNSGSPFVCAATSNGGLKCWGQVSQFGIGAINVPQFTPIDVIGFGAGVVGVACGASHFCVLTSGGGLKCMGGNFNGQLGDNSSTNRASPVDVFGLAAGVSAVVAGDAHTCALTSDKGVLCWGQGASGILGNGATDNSVVPAAVRF